MRIVHVVSSLAARHGGVSKAVVELATWQARLGADCHILSADDGPLFDISAACDAGVSTRLFPVRGPKKLAYLEGFLREVRERIQNAELFVIHGSYQFPPIAAALSCSRQNAPYIFMPHGSLDPAVRKAHPLRNRLIDLGYQDRILRKAAAWHFTSELERTRCERKVWRSSFVEPLGIDIESIDPESPQGRFRAEHEVPSDATLFLFLSRVTRKKGIEILLPAFLEVVSDRPDVYLALCGPIDDDMRALVSAAQADDRAVGRLITTGMIAGPARKAAFADADFFILPTYAENFGIAVFEALAFGLPVITTTGLDLHKCVHECGRALIVQPLMSEIRGAMTIAADNKWHPTKSVAEARAWLNAKFSWKRRAGTILRQYEITLAAA